MKQPFLILCAATGLAGCSSAPHCQSNDAQGVVQALQPRKQFSAILTMLVERTETAGMIRARDASSAERKIANAVDAAVERHEAEWERNLIAAWHTLGPADLEQACTAINARDWPTFEKIADRVGTEAQSRNEPLVRQAGAEVLEAVF